MDREENFLHTLEEMRSAINKRDYAKLTEHVDVKTFLDEGYDEATDELANRCAEFHKLYPHDLFFKFGSSVLRFYNSKFRSVHLGFVTRVTNAYFDKDLTPPKSFASNPINFSAVELSKLLKALSSEIKSVAVDDNHAVAEVEVSGDNSFYGKVWGTLNFKFEFVYEAGVWKLKRILNLRELVPPVLDMAERFWPADWDLGIKL